MNEKRIIRRLRFESLSYLLVAILFIVFFTSGIWEKGELSAHLPSQYTIQVTGILLTLGCIPLAIKGFSSILHKRIRRLPADPAHTAYRRWSEIRMALLWSAVFINLPVYYVTGEETGLYCAIMAFLATLYCFPSLSRMEEDLRKNGEEEKER